VSIRALSSAPGDEQRIAFLIALPDFALLPDVYTRTQTQAVRNRLRYLLKAMQAQGLYSARTKNDNQLVWSIRRLVTLIRKRQVVKPALPDPARPLTASDLD
jgi:hypothetical protein